MALKIFGSKMSIFVNKVIFVANYLNVDFEFVELNMMAGEHKSPEHIARHPFGKVPAFQDGDLTLFESNAICRYLADKNNSDIFGAGDLTRRAQIDQWLDFIALHIANAVTRITFNKLFAPRVPGEEVDEKSMAFGFKLIDKYFPIIDERLAKQKYLVDDKITLADIALVAMLDTAEATEIDIAKYPNISKYRAELRSQKWYTDCHQNWEQNLLAFKN